MTQPSTAQAKIIDQAGNPQLANRGNSVSVPVATAAAASENAGVTSFGTTNIALDQFGVIINDLRDDRDSSNVAIGQLIERLEAQGILADKTQ